MESGKEEQLMRGVLEPERKAYGVSGDGAHIRPTPWPLSSFYGGVAQWREPRTTNPLRVSSSTTPATDF